MNTSTEPKEITAADVVAWLKAKTAASGVKDITILLSNSGAPFLAYTLGSGVSSGRGETPEEAIADYLEKWNPSARAEVKRAEAAKLLAEADALTAAPRLQAY